MSGAPSTVLALWRRADPLESALAAGTLLLGAETRRGRLLAAGAAAHVTLSLGWALVLAAALPRHPGAGAAAMGGLAIAALDLGVVGQCYPRIRALPTGAQLADHVLYAVTVAAVLGRRRPGAPAP